MSLLLPKTVVSITASKTECITTPTYKNDFIIVFGSDSPAEDANTILHLIMIL